MADLLQYQDFLKWKSQGGRRYLFDPVRRKYVVLTPEELVRQLTILHLTRGLGFSLRRLSVERQLELNGMTKRYDLLAMERSGRPLLLVECKRPEVKLDESVCRQIAAYNLRLNVPWLMITNGREMYWFALDATANKYLSASTPPFGK